MPIYRLEIDIEDSAEDQEGELFDEIQNMLRVDILSCCEIICRECNKPQGLHLVDDGGYPYCL
jgi:hypothetical protein